jgi:hypothetical protein
MMLAKAEKVPLDAELPSMESKTESPGGMNGMFQNPETGL